MNARSLLFPGILLLVLTAPFEWRIAGERAPAGGEISPAMGSFAGGLRAQSREGADQLDREFYNDYLDSIPDDWQPDEGLLESNLFAALKRVLPKEDPFDAPDFLKNLQPDQLEYKRVTTDSAFIRGLFREAPYLKQTEYMWVVKSGPYMVFVTYLSDPERYTVAEFQNLVIKKKAADQSSPEHKDSDR